METNPLEALKNNVLATDAGRDCIGERCGALHLHLDGQGGPPDERHGATKRLGERLVKSLSNGRTRFMAVRFGNSWKRRLGRADVRRQIAAGGR